MKTTNNNRSKAKHATAKPQPTFTKERKPIAKNNGNQNALQPTEPPAPAYLASISLGNFDPITLKGMKFEDLEGTITTLLTDLDLHITYIGQWTNHALAEAIKLGFYLAEVKRRLQHGEFGDFLAKMFPKSEWTARRYMKMAKRAHVTDLKNGMSLRQACIAMGIVPKPPAQQERSCNAKASFTIPKLLVLMKSAEKCATGCLEHVPVEMFTSSALAELSSAVSALSTVITAAKARVTKAIEPKPVSGKVIAAAPQPARLPSSHHLRSGAIVMNPNPHPFSTDQPNQLTYNLN
jgi:hypothetical protein